MRRREFTDAAAGVHRRTWRCGCVALAAARAQPLAVPVAVRIIAAVAAAAGTETFAALVRWAFRIFRECGIVTYLSNARILMIPDSLFS